MPSTGDRALWGKNSWAGKVAGVVGTSPGAIGSAVAQSQLRSILPGLEVVVLGSPEVYLHALPGLLDSDMNVTDDATKAFLTSYLEKFARFIADHRTDARASVAA
jgi:chromate reductase